jgi:hypothetical protein
MFRVSFPCLVLLICVSDLCLSQVAAVRRQGSEEVATESPATHWTPSFGSWARHLSSLGQHTYESKATLKEHVPHHPEKGILLEVEEAVLELGEEFQHIPSFWRRKAAAMVTFVCMLAIGLIALLMAGLLAALRGQEVCHDLVKQGEDAKQLMTIKAVVQARLDVLRGVVDLAILHSQKDGEPHRPEKALTKLFNVLMERILACTKDGILEEEVIALLDEALDSNDQLQAKQPGVVAARRKLILELLNRVVDIAPAASTQGQLLSLLFEACRKRIEELVKDGLINDEVLIHLTAAKETDSMLKDRLLLLTKVQIPKSCDAIGGCLSALVS